MIEHARWTLGKSLKDFRIGIADETEVLSAIEALIEAKKHPPQRKWVGLTDEEVMIAAYQAGFDIHEDYDNEDDPEEMHWWTPDGEACDDSLLKLRDLIEAKLKEKNT